MAPSVMSAVQGIKLASHLAAESAGGRRTGRLRGAATTPLTRSRTAMGLALTIERHISIRKLRSTSTASTTAGAEDGDVVGGGGPRVEMRWPPELRWRWTGGCGYVPIRTVQTRSDGASHPRSNFL